MPQLALAGGHFENRDFRDVPGTFRLGAIAKFSYFAPTDTFPSSKKVPPAMVTKLYEMTQLQILFGGKFLNYVNLYG